MTIDPPTISECPPKYLVDELTTISASWVRNFYEIDWVDSFKFD